MASFETLKSGRTRVFLSVKGKRKTATFATIHKARSWAWEKEFELSQPIEEGSQITLGELFTRYADEVSPTKRGERWEIVRLQNFRRFKRLCRIKLCDLEREDFEQWIDERLTEVKPSSVNRDLNLISHCLTQARRWRLMSNMPLKDLQRPRNPPPRFRRISEAEQEEICLVMRYEENIPLTMKRQYVAVAFLFAIETAMRAGEICSLTPARVDTVNAVAKLMETKNGHPRDVPLSRRAIELLNKLPEPENEHSRLFQMNPAALSTLFRKYVHRTTIKDLTFHDTRHEAITRLADKVEVLDLARIVGHRDIRQLMTYYNKSASELSRLLD